MNSIPYSFVSAVAMLITVATQAQSVPSLINYQGNLTDPAGQPVSTADYVLSFSLHDAAQGGARVWGPQVFDGKGRAGHGAKVPVVQGYFNVLLGPNDTNNQPITLAFTNANRWIEITVGTNAPIAPRQQILSAPFSIRSGFSDTAGLATALVDSSGRNIVAAGAGGTSTGIDALSHATTGQINTANGSQSLSANTTGTANSALGHASLLNNTVGSDNVALGVDALFNNKEGSLNTAVGSRSLSISTNGTSNTAVGYRALHNINGDGNVALGAGAGEALGTGNDNVLIANNGVVGQNRQIRIGTEGTQTSAFIAGIFNNTSTGGHLTYVNSLGQLGSSPNVHLMGDVIDAPGRMHIQAAEHIYLNPFDNSSGEVRVGGGSAQPHDIRVMNGVVRSGGYGCRQGLGPDTTYVNFFNFHWSGSALQAWIDSVHVGNVQGVSDRRLKEDIQAMRDSARGRIIALTPVTFRYKTIPGTPFTGDPKVQEGFIADELQQIIPSAVEGQKDALTASGQIQPQTINVLPLVAVVTKAVQEQEETIRNLQLQVNELKKFVEKLTQSK